MLSHKRKWNNRFSTESLGNTFVLYLVKIKLSESNLNHAMTSLSADIMAKSEKYP